jgi:DNA-binding Lrp family transcriptional regulator
MPIAFVLVNVEKGNEHEVYRKLIKDFEEVHLLFGDFNLLVRVEAKNKNDLDQKVSDKIRAVKGVTETKTLEGIKKAP